MTIYPAKKPAPKKKQPRKPLKSSGRPKARNPKRHKAEWLRAYGSAERVAWIASLPCSVQWCLIRPCENAHTETGGVSRKANAETIIPLCRPHHRALHSYGIKTWQGLAGIDLKKTAAKINAAWLSHKQSRSEVAA